MIAFEVFLNGNFCTLAGSKDLSILSLFVDAAGRLGPETYMKYVPIPGHDLYLSVGGSPGGGQSSGETKHWISVQPLFFNDEVKLKVVDVESADEPISDVNVEIPDLSKKDREAKELVALEVSLNGKKLAVAGAKDLFTNSLIVTAKISSETSAADNAQTSKSDVSIDISLGGSTRSLNKDDKCLRWLDFESISVGDEILVRILDTDSVDEGMKTYSLKSNIHGLPKFALCK